MTEQPKPSVGVFVPADELIARALHDTYERLAPEHGYETREASAKPWDDVPADNKALMVATVETLLNTGVIIAPPPELDALLRGRHTSTVAIARYFAYGHLPEHLQAVSKPFCNLAARMLLLLDDGPELTAGLRKILEGKDCCVRAALD